jgi:hypothetical protein
MNKWTQQERNVEKSSQGDSYSSYTWPRCNISRVQMKSWGEKLNSSEQCTV